MQAQFYAICIQLGRAWGFTALLEPKSNLIPGFKSHHKGESKLKEVEDKQILVLGR